MHWPLLDALPATDRARILTTARRRQFARGEVVFHEGDPGDNLQLVETCPSVEQLVVAALAQRVEELGARLLEALYVGVDRRVYRRLLELADVCSRTSPSPVIPLSQTDLAGMAGASRPTVNQVLQKLVTRGTMSLQRRQITIEDLPALRAAAPGFDA